jgi:hypothetical protein
MTYWIIAGVILILGMYMNYKRPTVKEHEEKYKDL